MKAFVQSETRNTTNGNEINNNKSTNCFYRCYQTRIMLHKTAATFRSRAASRTTVGSPPVSPTSSREQLVATSTGYDQAGPIVCTL